MTVKQSSKKATSPYRVAALTAVLTIIISGSAAYFLGYLGPKDKEHSKKATEKKIAYWRAPMNPEEIYDKPGKSAMGMDLMPVYEDETNTSSGKDQMERKIAYWRAPMDPTEIYDKPGKSAMGMDLVPVYEDELVSGVDVIIDPVTQQNMGLRTAFVNKAPLVHNIWTYGHITADETRTVQVNPKFNGWIEKLYVDFTGKFVEKDQPLFEIFSPELLSAQEEYLVALRSMSRELAERGKDLLASSRRRLQYFDVPESEIRAIEKTGIVKKTLMIRSPVTGFVIQKNVEEGVFVKAGTMIFRIADLSRVWVEAHIYEFELPWIAKGQEAEMTLSYQPGKVFSGKVTYIYPYMQPKTRDVVIRLEFENPIMELKPDMYASVRIKTNTEIEGLVIPSEAVLRSGERNVVFVMREGGKYTPRDVTLGVSVDGGMVHILSGLAPNEVVVTSGQFLLDSESKLKEAIQKMLEAKRVKLREAREIEDEEEDLLKDVEEDM
jgi:Cu(I)/Ag(I) efflux system membrane fusion protein/cobalt-zinc-cadmium efflux system membrane fusion protein